MPPRKSCSPTPREEAMGPGLDRIRLVYADPETAFRAMRFEAVLRSVAARSNAAARSSRTRELRSACAAATGLLAGKRRREDGASPRPMSGAARDIERYLRDARARRLKDRLGRGAGAAPARLDRHPALSPAATVLEGARRHRPQRPAGGARLCARRPHGQGRDRRASTRRSGAVRRAERCSATARGPPAVPLFDKAADGLAPAEQQKLADGLAGHARRPAARRP
jgi:hypothetical protein